MPDKLEQVGRDEDIQPIAELIKDTKIAMLMTTTAEGWSRSRPMGMQSTSFDGTVWFFTHASEPKVQEIQHHPQVNISVANPSRNEYVSLCMHVPATMPEVALHEHCTIEVGGFKLCKTSVSSTLNPQ